MLLAIISARVPLNKTITNSMKQH